MNIWAVLNSFIKINYTTGVNFSWKDELIYPHAINVWNVFKINTMADDHDLY